MKKNFYAVKNGRKNGIYKTWSECQAQVTGYPSAVFKGFETLKEAEDFMGVNETGLTGSSAQDENTQSADDNNTNYAFVDGSFNIATKVYGYGGFLIENGNKHIISGNGKDPEMASMRNVAGEILGSMAAVKLAIELGLKELAIYYDYMGIQMWAEGSWKRNKRGTIEYYEYMQSVKDKIKLNFVKVKGHSGIEGNEEADRLAKKSAGI